MDVINDGGHIAREAAGRTAAAAAAGEYLTYRVGTEDYGVDIQKVQEIRSYEQPTRIPGAPECVKGVVNLRGTIVPIVDMRIKFNLGAAEYNEFTVAIILNVADRVVGMVVDSVSDVVQLSGEQIRSAPDFSSTFDTKYIIGLGALEERMLILVDIEKLMSGQDMALFEAASTIQ
jgi:purine-binding chemotaxis protein CheW